MKYACELSALGVEYLPREAVKAQALADFILELTGENPEADTAAATMASPEEGTTEAATPGEWQAHIDGSSTKLGG